MKTAKRGRVRCKCIMSKSKPTASTADEIAEMATRGVDISPYFTNKFTVVRPVRRVPDLTHKRSTKPKSEG